jgi:hypothetical protein
VIRIENPDGVSQGVVHAELDGETLAGEPVVIALVDDGATHHVRVRLGEPGSITAPPTARTAPPASRTAPPAAPTPPAAPIPLDANRL